MNAIETSNLSKSFSRGTVRAVRDVSLAVPAGAVYGLVGKNGAGKSTLLKLVAGLMRPDAGTVSVLGRQLRPCESDPRIGVLVEAPAVYGRHEPRPGARPARPTEGVPRSARGRGPGRAHGR